jgi:hypothetical protein
MPFLRFCFVIHSDRILAFRGEHPRGEHPRGEHPRGECLLGGDGDHVLFYLKSNQYDTKAKTATMHRGIVRRFLLTSDVLTILVFLNLSSKIVR